jgi:hypothetical protein
VELNWNFYATFNTGKTKFKLYNTAQERFRLLQEMELNPDRWFRWDKVVRVHVRQGSGGRQVQGGKGPGGSESRWVRVQMGHDLGGTGSMCGRFGTGFWYDGDQV